MRAIRLSPALFAIALTPVALQTSGDCGSPGNPRLTSLEVEADGIDRIVDFDPARSNYLVWLDGAAAITLRAQSVEAGATITWAGGAESGSLGIGAGEVILPTGAELTLLTVSVRTPGGARRQYTIRLDPSCASEVCNDANPCTTDSCDTIDYTCMFVPSPEGTICDFDYVGDGVCGAGTGTCLSNTVTLDGTGLSSGEHTDADGDGVFEAVEDREGATLTVQASRSDVTSAGTVRRATIEYDFWPVPPDAEIVHAEFEVRLQSALWAGGLELEILTFEGDGSTTTADAAAEAVLQDTLSIGIDGTESIANVTSGVAELVARGASAIGIRMELVSESEPGPVNHSATFYGLDSPFEWEPPKLRLVYQVRKPERSVFDWVSRAFDGGWANDNSLWDVNASDDGNLVVFDSHASNLVPDDTNGVHDIFVYDRNLGATTRVSVGPGGEEATDYSTYHAISADARVIAFMSRASNLVSGDTNGHQDIFVHDLGTGTTERVSVTSSGGQLDRFCSEPSISSDGRYVSFTTSSPAAVEDTDILADIYLHDRQTGETRLVSPNGEGIDPAAGCARNELSGTGEFVVFACDNRVYLHDVTNGTNELISVDHAGAPAFGNYPHVSDNGRIVVFASDEALVPHDTNGEFDVYMRDRRLQETRLISLTPNGEFSPGRSGSPSISSDGRRVSFTQEWPGIGFGSQALLWDGPSDSIILISAGYDGEPAMSSPYYSRVSRNGSWVGFSSHANYLIPNDSGGVSDAFVAGIE